jgi:hypothetical protein
MKLGELTKARSRFQKAISLGGVDVAAQSNLDLLKAVMPRWDFESAHSRQGGREPYIFGTLRQEHVLTNIPIITAAEYAEDKKWMSGGSPFILKLGGNPESFPRWNMTFFGLEQLVRNFGADTVDFYPHNMGEESVTPLFSNLSSAVVEVLDPGQGMYSGMEYDASLPGTYIQWNLSPAHWDRMKRHMGYMPDNFVGDQSWLELGKCFTDADTRGRFFKQSHWNMLLVGERGAGMFNHKDTLRIASYQVQLHGRKRWHLCRGSTEDRYMYKAGDVNAFAPDYEKYPLFKQAQCLQAEVGPGEILFYGTDWWHQTQNLDTPTISLSGSVIDAYNWQIAREAFMTECHTPRIMYPDEQVCAALERCYGLWKRKFGSERADTK